MLKVQRFVHDSFVFTWIRKRRRRKGRKRRRKRRRERRGRLTMTMASQMREMRTLVEILINKTPTTGAGLTREGGALGNKIKLSFGMIYFNLLKQNCFMK